MKINEAVQQILALARSGASDIAEIPRRVPDFLSENFTPGAVSSATRTRANADLFADNPAGAGVDLMRAYLEMVNAKRLGADKYFHCRGNCEAAQRGPISEWTAARISNGREAAQMRGGETLQDALEDQKANHFGRLAGRTSPRATCRGLCGQYRGTLPPPY